MGNLTGDGAGILQNLVDQSKEMSQLYILRRESDPDEFAFCCKKLALAAGRMERRRWETGEGPLVAIGDNDGRT